MTTCANLLPKRFRRKELIRTRTVQWLIGCGISCLVVTGVIHLRHSRLEMQRRQLAAMEAECVPLRKLQLRTAAARVRLAEMAERQTLLNRMPGEQPVLAAIAAVSRSATLPAAWVQVRHFTLNATAHESPSPNASAPADIPARLVLHGIAADDIALAGFIGGLRDSGVFRLVQLKSSLKTSITDRVARDYHIECEF